MTTVNQRSRLLSELDSVALITIYIITVNDRRFLSQVFPSLMPLSYLHSVVVVLTAAGTPSPESAN